MGAALSSHRDDKQDQIRKAQKHLKDQYDGEWHWSVEGRTRRPAITPHHLKDRMLELQDAKQVYRKRRYLNPWRANEHEKFPDVDAYYSTNKEYPRRLVVQASSGALDDAGPRHWSRRKIRGNVPLIISLAELCLNPLGLEQFESGYDDEDESERHGKQRKENPLTVLKRILHVIAAALSTLGLAWIIQLLLSIQVVTAPWSDDGTAEPYDEYENVQWYWPKHAVNVLDQSPENKKPQSQLTNLTIPRRLVVRDPQTKQWVAKETTELRDEKTGMLRPYIFLSFSRANYPGKEDHELRPFLYHIAEAMLKHENRKRDIDEPPIEAFWIDVDCVSPADANDKTEEAKAESKRTKDVNSICDAVRCAKRVYVVLPSNDPNEKAIWGQRIWTLPEVLLAAGKTRYCFSHPDAIDKSNLELPHFDLTLTDMYGSFWPGPTSRFRSSHEERTDEQPHEDVIGHLVNHYTSTTTLSELQLFTCAIQAMAKLSTGKNRQGYTTTDMAYAAMGLLSYRISPNPSDSAFQAIARLSLVNDSNLLLERLVCLWPFENTQKQLQAQLDVKDNVAGSATILGNIADRDQFSIHLWDIKPLCSVVGIGDDEYTPTVILDRCRGIPIRWKDFPRVRYIKDLNGFRATMAQKAVYAGAWFLLTGFGLFSSAISLQFSLASGQSDIDVSMYLVGVALFVGCAWIISWFSPWAVRQLCNSGATGVSCHLVGFEGTMPLKDIEKIIYGNFNHRLTYAPSSTVFSRNLRNKKTREGIEPEDSTWWQQEAKRLNVPQGHRLFTIVDTGSMTVSVIAAERPPVVALVCGREGGMVRALLCSWRFEQNCLYRECVMRMRSSVEYLATPNDWLKVSLASQGDVSRTRLEHLRRMRKQAKAPPTPPPKDEPSTVSAVKVGPHIASQAVGSTQTSSLASERVATS
ncbi:uncharacterized protein N7482_003993 [Penicillium canariense]|uniref:Heterokaryon incompatibility domain-containing protein n=1 Tax=Penicillium canariense TaxID=189055 RepID=A0A9W9LNY9_9EURO|nr:uncharacterized protein N7482_003993 [Penicillium canariense]KAJ5168399.1 hypothetical protein N7482_003993 [Penicillium canariense]